MTRFVVVTPKSMSVSAKKLAQELNGICVLQNSSTFKARLDDKVINWGCSKLPKFVYNLPSSLNAPQQVAKAINKLNTFTEWKLKDVPHPNWTTEKETALEYNSAVVCRTNLSGYGADGLVLSTVPDLIDAPLYVEYIKKRHEYRVHVFQGKVIDVAWKRKKKGVGHVNSQIRNYKNGWVYCREDITEPSDLRTLAVNAVTALDLDFGAVDIIWNEAQNKCYALEVNTAPGLVGTTIERYIDAIKQGVF